MISSISSSDVRPDVLAEPAVGPVRRATRIALVLLVALVAVEAVTRWKFVRMSKEFEQFGAYPARAGALAAAPGLRVAVLGASIVHEDVDAALLADRLRAATGRPLVVEPFSADHSYIDSWYFMLQHYFWRPGRAVDLVVLPFVAQSLYDGNELEIGRLARYFTDVVDWPEALRMNLATTADRADFLVSSVWASFAARDRMQELVFTRLLPDYKGYATAQQAAMTAHQIARTGRRRRARTTLVLEHLMAVARAHGTRLCFVAFPSLHADWNEPYTDIRGLVAGSGMDFLDLRRVPDLDADSYTDQVHMNAAGRAVFTRQLAEALAPVAAPVAETAELARPSETPGS